MEKSLFREKCEQYLLRQSLMDLRSYGRYLNLLAPTTLKKEELIKEIVKVLCGELSPQRSKRGAPIKNYYVAPHIIQEIEKLKRGYTLQESKVVFFENSSQTEEKASNFILQINFPMESLSKKTKRLIE